MKTITEKARDIPVVEEVDVVVVGGGPAGIVASIAAARNGAKALLVESNPFLGGIAATGIPFQGFHDDSNRQIIRGIGWELVERLISSGASPGPWFFKNIPRAGGSLIMYDPSKLKTTALEMVREAGADVLLHTMSVCPIVEDHTARGIFIESKSGREAILAKVVIDCTGDGDIAAKAGAEFEQGNENGQCQPVTFLFTITNVDMKSFLGYIDEHPQEFGIENPSPGYWHDYQKGIRTGAGGLKKLCEEAKANGEYDMPNPLVAVACLPQEGEVIVNMAFVKLVDSSSNRDLTRAEITGSDYVWKTMSFLKKYVQGFENANVKELVPVLGVRESRRIIGEHILDIDEMLECKKFDDRICKAARGTDVHDPTPDNSQSCVSMYMPFPDGYYIPFRCLVPKGLKNILIAGRCISVSYRAFGSTRVMAPCMAEGQATGTAAALAIKNGSNPGTIDIVELQNLLKEQGALID